MNFDHFFWSFWWLIFPVGGMLMGLFAMIGHYNHRREALRILKSYADQGKDPPPALLDAIKSDEERYYDDGYYGRRRWRRHRYGYGWGGFGPFVPFAALAAGFGWYGYYGGGPSVFTALALAFGIAAVFMLIGGLISLATRPKLPPYDDRDAK